MITEDYVSFETAKLLKEKGFNERLLTFYITDEAKKEGYFELMAFTDDKIDNNHSDHCYLAPTLQMVMKWLREVHKLFIWVEYDPPTFTADIYKMNEVDEEGSAKYIPPTFANAKTYEQIVEEAVKYCLEHLI